MSSHASAKIGVAHNSPFAEGVRNRRLDIQGLRAVAVLMVVAFHAGLPVPGGFVGVDVFFVISGFVITAMLMREWEATGRIRLGRFYVRRFKRLTPALALTVGVVMLASALLLSPLGGGQQNVAKTAIGAMLLTANVVIARTTGNYFDAPAEGNPLLNTWSLSVEEQFYLVFPAILLLGWILGQRVRRPKVAPVALVVMVGVVSFALAIIGSAGVELPLVPESLVGFYGPATRAWEFAVGALLALPGAKSRVSSRHAPLIGWAGVVMLAASLWLITDMTPFPGPWTLLPVIGTLLLLAAGSANTGVARALASRPMVTIGDVSYSIYLWHWPSIVFAQLLWPGRPWVLVASAAASLVPAYASYRWVEQPLRTLPQDRGLPLLRVVTATVIPPLALAGLLGFAARNSFWNDSIRMYQAAIEPSHIGLETGCAHEAWSKPTECTWNSQADGRPIYLVGDSHADHFSEALIAAAEATSRPMTGLSENGCAYLPVSLTRPDQGREWESQCQAYLGKTEGYLSDAKPGLVVVANSYWWFRDGSGVGVGAPGETPSDDPATKRRVLSEGLSQAVLQLQEAGHVVLVVQAVPQWGGRDAWSSWSSCSMLDMAGDGCSRTMSMTEVSERQGEVAEIVAAVARERGAALLDVSEDLCPGGTCSSVTPEGLVRYRDGGHITVEQSKELTEVFRKAVQAAG